MNEQWQFAFVSGVIFILMGCAALVALGWLLRNGMKGYFLFLRDRMPRYQKYERQLWVLTYGNVATALFVSVGLIAFGLLFIALGLSPQLRNDTKKEQQQIITAPIP